MAKDGPQRSHREASITICTTDGIYNYKDHNYTQNCEAQFASLYQYCINELYNLTLTARTWQL